MENCKNHPQDSGVCHLNFEVRKVAPCKTFFFVVVAAAAIFHLHSTSLTNYQLLHRCFPGFIDMEVLHSHASLVKLFWCFDHAYPLCCCVKKIPRAKICVINVKIFAGNSFAETSKKMLCLYS
jgi:hypothetical protein